MYPDPEALAVCQKLTLNYYEVAVPKVLNKRLSAESNSFVPVLGSQPMLTLFRYFRLVYNSPFPDVPGCVQVCVGRVAARPTYKFTLALSVGFLAMATLVACTACVFWVNSDDWHTVQPSLVGHKLSQLRKCPATHLCPLVTPKPSPIADVRQVFQRNPTCGVFGVHNERLRNAVIEVTTKARLLIANAIQGTTSVLSGTPLIVSAHLPAERSSGDKMPLPNSFDVFSGHMLAVASGNDFGYSHVNAYEIRHFDWGFIGQVDGAEQVELSVSVDEITLAFKPVESLPLVLPENDRDDLPTFQGQQTHPIHALEAHQPFIVSHCPVRFEHRTAILVAREAFHSLADSANGHLARQAKLLTQFSVTAAVNGGLREYSGIKPYPGGMRSCGIKLPHRGQQQLALIGIRKNLNLQRQLHGCSLGQTLSTVNGSGHFSVA